ncbi:TPA: hypothetical protein ACKQEW_000361 [Pseudomonas aeruginosa]
MVLEETGIDGLRWIENNFFTTSASSRIILPNPNQRAFSVVVHGGDFSDSDHNGYEYYGIHLGQDDVLCFLTYDDRLIRGDFVDCRAESKTLHKRITLEYGGHPDRSLVIPRGVAHIFDNLKCMTTINQARHYIDFYNKDFNKASDVINVKRGALLDEFPVLRPNRYPAPSWVIGVSLKLQRINAKNKREYPFNFMIDGKIRTVYSEQAGEQYKIQS